MKLQTGKAQKLFAAAVNAEEKGHLNKALQLYQKVAEIDRASPIPRICIASLLFDQGKWRDAIKAARRVTKRWPDSYHAYSIIGRSYLEQDQFLRAERAFRQELAIKPEPWTWVLLSRALLRLEREKESKACLRNALKLDPNYAEAHYNLGCQYQLRRQFALAEKHLRRAIEIDPKYSIAYAELGWVLLRRKNQITEAVRLLRKSIRLDPNYGWSRVYLANALWRLKRIKAADEQYHKFMELWPDDPMPYWCYGSFLAYEGDSDALAEEYLRRAIELDPKDESANYFLGKHLFDWNRTREAVKFLRKAARLGHDKAKKILQTMGKKSQRITEA